MPDEITFKEWIRMGHNWLEPVCMIEFEIKNNEKKDRLAEREKIRIKNMKSIGVSDRMGGQGR